MAGTALPLASAHSLGSTSLQKSRFPSDFSSSLSGGSKKEKGSYGKALSSHCLRAHQQRDDLIFVAPGGKRMEFCTAHGSRTQKWQADRDSDRHFCPGRETLPHHPLRSSELGAQPPRGGRRGHHYPWTVHRKDSCS